MAPENRDEVRQRIDSLYDRAENATGNFNATRAMAARTRSRGVPLAKRRGSYGQDPAHDAVARQWFDGVRATLGPTVPAVLPADRLPAAPARPRDGMGGLPGADRESRALTGGDRRELALPGPDREVLALPAGDREVLALPAGGGDSLGLPPGGGVDAVGLAGGGGEVRALPAGDRRTAETDGPALLLSDTLLPRDGRATAALTAGPATEPPAFPRQATESVRTAVPVVQTVQQPYFADDLPGGGAGWVPDPAWAHSSSYAGAQQLAEPPSVQAAQTVQPAQAEQWRQPAWEAPGPAAAALAMPAAGVRTMPTATPVTDTGSFTYPPAPTGVTDTGSFTYQPAPAVTDTGSFTYPPAPTGVTDTGSFTYQPAPAVTDTGSFTYPPTSAAPFADTGAAAYSPALLTDTGSLTYPVAPTPVIDTGSFAPLSDTGSYTAPVSPAADPLPLPVPVPESPRALRAAKAIAFARAQVGKPCVWGATGPDSYDCSSLTLAAWRAAGVALPRAAHQQALAGAPVTLAGIEPGDLVLFFDDDRHVGLHVGDGMMVHAPGPGSTIREESIYGAGEAAIHRVVRPA
ncbi:Cell wall-associated hydrolase, NlpC family [Streptomyces sp. 2231.1]|uniref:C40 family peptidase n=1 Tax=Streptomyces sp. 2231.1 TaxID=1855347 RepID=UPI0008948A07|nr:Cell wall-associated hydrolase, NlpC family [Streptomyces sp. 2231.1]